VRILLAITEGPAAGQTIIIRPGETVRIGRGTGSNYIIEDAFLSSVHFAINNSGDRCTVTDLNSRNGLAVNGERVQERVLRPFGTISAGASQFVANFLEDSEVPAELPEKTVSLPSPAPEIVELTMTVKLPAMVELNQLQKAVVHSLCQGSGRLYGILDSAQDAAILELLRNSKDEYQILYDGRSAEDLVNDGPYLVKFPESNELLANFVSRGWGKNWGVFLRTYQDLADLRKHLRHFLMVEMPNGKVVYLRFYDPRVMRQFVTGFNGEEARQFFGPIRYYLCEAEDVTRLMILGVGSDGVITKEQPMEKN
jgi:hypothetical protein